MCELGTRIKEGLIPSSRVDVVNAIQESVAQGRSMPRLLEWPSARRGKNSLERNIRIPFPQENLLLRCRSGRRNDTRIFGEKLGNHMHRGVYRRVATAVGKAVARNERRWSHEEARRHHTQLVMQYSTIHHGHVPLHP